MNLLRSHILGFGKLQNRVFEFVNGLNLIFAANEGGKSTLQRFLIASLYGQLRSDLKVQRRMDPWVDQYKPWHGTEYGGITWCRLVDGREVEIHRAFGKDETRIEIRASSGEDITRQYEQQRNGEVLFARYHFGMPKELFESIAVIRENRAAEIQGYETIRDRIANLAHSGDEELSIRQSLARIQEKLDAIGSDRAPTKPYKQALDLVQALRDEQKALDLRRDQFQHWVEDRNRIAAEIARLEQDLQALRSSLLRARRQEMSARIESMEGIQNELTLLRSTIESLGGRVDFPADRLGELDQLLGARDSIAKHLGEIRVEKEAAQTQLDAARSQRESLSAYAPMAAGADAEKITEWFVSYLSISLQKDGLQKTQNRLNDEAIILEKRLSELSPAFSNQGNDWERMAREAAEDEQLVAQNSAALNARILAEKANLAAAEKTTRSRRILGCALLLLAGALPASRVIAGYNRYAPWLDAGVALVIGAAAIICFAAASRSVKVLRSQAAMLRTLDFELDNLREEGSKKRSTFNEAMRTSGFQKADDFLSAARRSDQDRQKLADLRIRLKEAEQQREHLQEQLLELYQKLKDGLGKAGISCSPGNLKFQIDLFRANLRRFRELDAGYASCAEKTESLRSKYDELAEEHSRKCSRIAELLEQAQVRDPVQFREACVKRLKLLELLDREASRNREYSRLTENLTLDQWKEQLRQLMELEEPKIPESSIAKADTTDAEPFLPYIPTIPEMEEQEKRLRSLLSSAREEHAGAVERVKQAFQNFRPQYSIEEDLAIAERNANELEKNRLALEMALDTVNKLSRQQQEVLAPQLNAAVEQRFLRLCTDRYEEVKIDPDFQVWVREIDGGELRLAEHLSRGTQDQIYFSMRFGIMDLVSNSEEPCPALLDEPFAAYDLIRLVNAFEVLAKEAETRQIILFTCREDLLDLGAKLGANVIHL